MSTDGGTSTQRYIGGPFEGQPVRSDVEHMQEGDILNLGHAWCGCEYTITYKLTSEGVVYLHTWKPYVVAPANEERVWAHIAALRNTEIQKRKSKGEVYPGEA